MVLCSKHRFHALRARRDREDAKIADAEVCAVCISHATRATRADGDGGVPQIAHANRGQRKVSFPGASAYAAARVWVQARERRTRHAGGAALSRAQEHPTHGALH